MVGWFVERQQKPTMSHPDRKNEDPKDSWLTALRILTPQKLLFCGPGPAIRVQTLPLKDPKILRVEIFPEYNCLEPQMGPHVLEDLTHKMEGETPQKRGQLGFR